MTLTRRSGTAIAVMTSKGGVGKSTISLGLAETIACGSMSKVLLIDADPQGSITAMMDLEDDAPKSDRMTLVSLLSAALGQSNSDVVEQLVASGVRAGGSDIDGADRLDILPVGSGLIELERQLTRSGREADLARVVSHLLDALRKTYDVVLVDCSPGLYLSTECWLQFCDFHLAPVKADKISISALDLVLDFRRASRGNALSKWLGIVVNSYQGNDAENAILRKVSAFRDLRMFQTIVPSTLAFQRLSIKHGDRRSYQAKYPGVSAESLIQLSKELIARMASRLAPAEAGIGRSPD